MSGLNLPPRLATALLKLLSNDDALAGDLLEASQSGRSRWWYWRQVVAAIFHTVVSDVRAHPALTMRGIFVAWIFIQCALVIVFWMLAQRRGSRRQGRGGRTTGTSQQIGDSQYHNFSDGVT